MDIEYKTKLDITAGSLIPVIQISDHLVIGRVVGSKLAKIAPDPRTLDPIAVKHWPALQRAADLHAVMQRMFERKKKSNVAPYADFLLNEWSRGEGVAPVMLGYSESRLTVDVDEHFGWGFAVIPDNIALVMIDGDTQLAARHEAMEKLADQYVSLAIYHGKPVAFARKGFRTVNTMGIKVSSSIAIAMDDEDPITSITNEIATTCDVLRGKVNRMKRQLGSQDKEIVTISALRQSVACFACGVAGLQYGAKPVPVDAAHVDQLRENSLAWYSALTRRFEAAFQMKHNGMITTPAVLAALGVIGRDALSGSMDDASRDSAFEAKLDELVNVNWSRGEHWLSAGAKQSSGGKITIGGPKECTYLVYNALSAADSEGGFSLRGLQKAAA